MRNTILLAQEYERRALTFRDGWAVGRWRLKVYDIERDNVEASPELVRIARGLASEAIANLAPGVADHQVGFVGIRAGRRTHVVFVALWCNENELRFAAYRAAATDVPSFERVASGEPTLCVWDIELLARERDAWVEHMLERAEGPDVAGYLSARADAGP